MTGRPSPHAVTLIGFGAIGRSVYEGMVDDPQVRISHIVVTPMRLAEVSAAVRGAAEVCTGVPVDATLALECAGHAALREHVLPALARGVECAVLSVGALSELGLPERLADAAQQGRTRAHLLAGAIGGIDAIAAARAGGLDHVTYTGRKPPTGWRGSAAEQVVNLDALTEPAVILEATAREASHLYPKNANVAAMVSLAGLGLDATQVRLIADPSVGENIHEIEARGAFGEMRLIMRGRPLADNPRTSALTVLSALRFLKNRAATLVM